MRRFLVCCGARSRPRSLEWLEKAVESRKPDGILFAGGVLDAARQYAVKPCTPWGMTRSDAAFVEHFFQFLGKLGVFTAIIPGPEDTPLDDFLRMGMHAEVEFPNLHLVHGTLLEKGDVAISGIGGHVSEECAYERDVCSRVMAEYWLRPLWTAKQPHRILLLPAPPPGALGGADGKRLAGDLIDSYHPGLCVVHGLTDHRGTLRIGKTLIVNPGALVDGSAAVVDWSKPADDQVEFLKLRSLERAANEVGIGD
jgi:hypothetical protein